MAELDEFMCVCVCVLEGDLVSSKHNPCGISEAARRVADPVWLR